MSRPSSILIVLHGAIGDVTRALPLAIRIKRDWPQARLSWGVEPISASLVQHHPAVDRVVIFERKGGLAAYRRYISELRSEQYDVVLDLQRHLKSGATSFLSGAGRRIGFHRKNAKEFNWLFNNEHIEQVEHFSPKIQYYQKFGDLLGLRRLQPLEFGLSASDDERRRIDELLEQECAKQRISRPGPQRLAALILGSTWPSRFWPAAHYADVVRALAERFGIVCVMVGSRSEEAPAHELTECLRGTPIINLVSKTKLRELAALFSACRFAVGSDSGPMHIAAAAGIPVISLWGSTSSRRSAPYGSESLVLSSPIGCSPCFRRTCPGLGTLCMEDIPPRAVMAQVERILGPGELQSARSPS